MQKCMFLNNRSVNNTLIKKILIWTMNMRTINTGAHQICQTSPTQMQDNVW